MSFTWNCLFYRTGVTLNKRNWEVFKFSIKALKLRISEIGIMSFTQISLFYRTRRVSLME